MRKHGPRLIYLVPAIHTPTATTMSSERCEKIYSGASRYGAAIIEDDPYRYSLCADAAAFPGSQAHQFPQGGHGCFDSGIPAMAVIQPQAVGERPCGREDRPGRHTDAQR